MGNAIHLETPLKEQDSPAEPKSKSTGSRVNSKTSHRQTAEYPELEGIQKRPLSPALTPNYLKDKTMYLETR